jgi:SP family facilitated glucose transporter-like MFS transporter 8
MGIVRFPDNDVESGVVGTGGGGGEVTAPLLLRDDRKEGADAKIQVDEEVDSCGRGRGGSLSMVLLSTAVAVCGSFEFGTCVSRLSLLRLSLLTSARGLTRALRVCAI